MSVHRQARKAGSVVLLAGVVNEGGMLKVVHNVPRADAVTLLCEALAKLNPPRPWFGRRAWLWLFGKFYRAAGGEA